MTTHNFAALAFKANLEKTPDLMTVDTAKIEASANQRRVEMAKLNQTIEPIRVEYNRLRKEKYDAQQNAKNAEIYFNNIAANVREWQKRVDDLLKRKKKATADNLLGEERSLESQIQRLENELLDERDKLTAAQRNNTLSARALREWPGDVRLAELVKELGE